MSEDELLQWDLVPPDLGSSDLFFTEESYKNISIETDFSEQILSKFKELGPYSYTTDKDLTELNFDKKSDMVASCQISQHSGSETHVSDLESNQDIHTNNVKDSLASPESMEVVSIFDGKKASQCVREPPSSCENSLKSVSPPPPEERSQNMLYGRKRMPYPRYSLLSNPDQVFYLTKFIEYKKKQPERGCRQYARFLQLHKKVQKEQKEFSEYLQKVSLEFKEDYAFLQEVAAEYMQRKHEAKLKRLQEYSPFWLPIDKVPISTNQRTAHELQPVKILLQMGEMPVSFQFPKAKLQTVLDYEILQKKFPTDRAQSEKNESPFYDHQVCSDDINAQRLAQKYQCHIVVSSSVLKCLVDNHAPHFENSWDVPVNIHEYQLEDSEKDDHKVVFLDKPFYRQQTTRDINSAFHKISLAARNLHPNHASRHTFYLGSMLHKRLVSEERSTNDALSEEFNIMDDSFLETFGTSTSHTSFGTVTKEPVAEKGNLAESPQLESKIICDERDAKGDLPEEYDGCSNLKPAISTSKRGDSLPQGRRLSDENDKELIEVNQTKSKNNNQQEGNSTNGNNSSNLGNLDQKKDSPNRETNSFKDTQIGETVSDEQGERTNIQENEKRPGEVKINDNDDERIDASTKIRTMFCISKDKSSEEKCDSDSSTAELIIDFESSSMDDTKEEEKLPGGIEMEKNSNCDDDDTIADGKEEEKPLKGVAIKINDDEGITGMNVGGKAEEKTLEGIKIKINDADVDGERIADVGSESKEIRKAFHIVKVQSSEDEVDSDSSAEELVIDFESTNTDDAPENKLIPDKTKKPIPDTPRSPICDKPASPVHDTPASLIQDSPGSLVPDTLASPIRGTPASPMRGIPASPMRDTPASPMRGIPASPMRDTPASTMRDTPASPMHGTPASPMRGTPASPMRGTPASPMRGTPASPMRGTPASPMRGIPASPMRDTPASPMHDTPTSPTHDTPVSLMRDTPASPTRGTPASPTRDTPASPTRDTPASPTRDTPASPTRDTPASLMRDTPASPMHNTPASLMRDTPASLMRDTPASPTRDTPASPMHNTPASLMRDTPASLMRDTPASPMHNTPASLMRDTPASLMRDTPASLMRDTPASPTRDTPASPMRDTPASPMRDTPASPVPETPASPIPDILIVSEDRSTNDALSEEFNIMDDSFLETFGTSTSHTSFGTVTKEPVAEKGNLAESPQLESKIICDERDAKGDLPEEYDGCSNLKPAISTSERGDSLSQGRRLSDENDKELIEVNEIKSKNNNQQQGNSTNGNNSSNLGNLDRKKDSPSRETNSFKDTQIGETVSDEQGERTNIQENEKRQAEVKVKINDNDDERIDASTKIRTMFCISKDKSSEEKCDSDSSTAELIIDFESSSMDDTKEEEKLPGGIEMEKNSDCDDDDDDTIADGKEEEKPLKGVAIKINDDEGITGMNVGGKAEEKTLEGIKIKINDADVDGERIADVGSENKEIRKAFHIVKVQSSEDEVDSDSSAEELVIDFESSNTDDAPENKLIPDKTKKPIPDTPRSPICDTPASPICDTPASPICDTPASPMHDTPASPICDTPESPMRDTPESPMRDTPESPSLSAKENPSQMFDRPLVIIPTESDENVYTFHEIQPQNQNISESTNARLTKKRKHQTAFVLGPLDSILEKQEELLKTTSRMKSENTETTMTGIPEMDILKQLDDNFYATKSPDNPEDYLQPDKGKNVTYCIWNFGDLRLLVRCKYSSIRKTKRRKDFVYMMPKLEYQVGFGYEQTTLSEASTMWISSLVRHNCFIDRIRINAFTSDIMMEEMLSFKQISQLYNPISANAFMYNLFRRLYSLKAGSYLVSHNAGEKMSVISQAMPENHHSQAFDLKKMYPESIPIGIPSVIPWVPIDTNLLTQYHTFYERVPCTFHPQEKKKFGKGKKKKNKK